MPSNHLSRSSHSDLPSPSNGRGDLSSDPSLRSRPRKRFASAAKDGGGEPRQRRRESINKQLSPLTRAEQNQRDLQAFRLCSDQRERLELRDRLVRNNLPLVYAITARMAETARLSREDLQQIGSLGLLRAIEAFQPSRGRSLSSFAVPYIRGAIQHELRDRYSLVRIPRDLWDLRRRATALQERRQRQGLTSLGPQALAAALGCDPGRLLEALQVGTVMEMRSLDAPCLEEAAAEAQGRSLLDSVADPTSLAGLQPEEIPPRSSRSSEAGSRAAGANEVGASSPPGATAEQRWLQRHLAALEPLQRELLLGHVCCGRTWAELGRELRLHPRQAQRLTTVLLVRLQQEGERWRTSDDTPPPAP